MFKKLVRFLYFFTVLIHLTVYQVSTFRLPNKSLTKSCNGGDGGKKDVSDGNVLRKKREFDEAIGAGIGIASGIASTFAQVASGSQIQDSKGFEAALPFSNFKATHETSANVGSPIQDNDYSSENENSYEDERKRRKRDLNDKEKLDENAFEKVFDAFAKAYKKVVGFFQEIGQEQGKMEDNNKIKK